MTLRFGHRGSCTDRKATRGTPGCGVRLPAGRCERSPGFIRPVRETQRAFGACEGQAMMAERPGENGISSRRRFFLTGRNSFLRVRRRKAVRSGRKDGRVRAKNQEPCFIIESSPSRMLQGFGGHPGIKTSTGINSESPLWHSRLSRNRPPEMAQEPTATTMRGSGTASYVSRRACRMFSVTGPVTTRPSAWRGRGHEVDAEAAEIVHERTEHVGISLAGVAASRADFAQLQRPGEQRQVPLRGRGGLFRTCTSRLSLEKDAT